MRIGSNVPRDFTELNELLPDDACFNDYENIDERSELIGVQSNRLSLPFIEYLRSVLQPMYQKLMSTDQNATSDAEFIMITCPRVIAFELFVVRYALNLLTYISETTLFHRSSLEQDEA